MQYSKIFQIIKDLIPIFFFKYLFFFLLFFFDYIFFNLQHFELFFYYSKLIILHFYFLFIYLEKIFLFYSKIAIFELWVALQILWGLTFDDIQIYFLLFLLYFKFFCISIVIHFWSLYKFLLPFLNFLLFIVCILLSVALYTLAERKVMASMQRRRGPNVVGFWGLLQPIADAVKLIFKEYSSPKYAENQVFTRGPFLMFVVSFTNWLVIPFGYYQQFPIGLSLIFFYAVNSLSVFGLILSGWASNSKYAFLGALRSAAQMISYEVSLGFIFLIIGAMSGSYNLIEIALKQQSISFVAPLLPVFLISIISILAETNRIPFDLPEAEAELVAGYNTEYSSMGFTLFFLAEYSNMLLMSFLVVLCFFKGWLGVFGKVGYFFKVVAFAFFLIWVRATLPRYRYDQLMLLGWKTFLPFLISYFMLIVGIFLCFGIFPYTPLPNDVLLFQGAADAAEFLYYKDYAELYYPRKNVVIGDRLKAGRSEKIMEAYWHIGNINIIRYIEPEGQRFHFVLTGIEDLYDLNRTHYEKYLRHQFPEHNFRLKTRYLVKPGKLSEERDFVAEAKERERILIEKYLNQRN